MRYELPGRTGKSFSKAQLDWSEGQQLVVVVLPRADLSGIPEDVWPNSPAAIANWLKWYDALEPLLITADEEADAHAWMKKVNDYSIANVDKSIEDVFG